MEQLKALCTSPTGRCVHSNHQHCVHSNTNTMFIPTPTPCSFQHQHCVHSNTNTMFIPTPTLCSFQCKHHVYSNTNTMFTPTPTLVFIPTLTPCSFQHHALSNNNNTTFIPTLTRHLREVFKYFAITARRLFIYMSIALSIAMYSLRQLSELRQLMRGE